jgi:hypothetical protein
MFAANEERSVSRLKASGIYRYAAALIEQPTHWL